MSPYLLLLMAIATEVVGTIALKLSHGMTRWWPAMLVVAGYGTAFWLLSLSLKTLPVGLVYAVWSGVGIAAIKAVGVLWFGESFDLRAVAGSVLIIAGVLVLTLGPSTAETAGR